MRSCGGRVCLQILRLMIIPAIPVTIWVLWAWDRQEEASDG